MVKQKGQKRSFQGMNYPEVQRANSNHRALLRKEDQQWLKTNGYRNVGWDNVIRLYQKIAELLEQYRLEEVSLEELFLEADRIGQQYQTPEEVEAFNQQYAAAVSEIEGAIDQHFPDTVVEIIDFGKKTRPSARQRSGKVKR
jgi:hypothetical protein